MSLQSFSSEKFYQTQPPVAIGPAKLQSILEYLIFSGSSVFLNFEHEKLNSRIGGSVFLVDYTDDELVFEAPNANIESLSDESLIVNFGYKRKRANFKSTLLRQKDRLLYVKRPESVILTNLRRNPRLFVDQSNSASSMQIEIQAETSLGDVIINRAELFEFSQLGLSFFVAREDALLLPGDTIKQLKVSIGGAIVLQTQGKISRVDTLRRSENLGDSYQVVLHFQERMQPKLQEIKRGAKRVPILESSPCYFTAEHPFFPGHRLEGQVFEISSSGLSCAIDKTSFPIIPGMRFPNCRLQLPHCSSRELTFEVMHVSYKSDGETSKFRIGGEFVNASVELLKDISIFTQKQTGSFVEDLTQEDLDLLWEFMFETNFIYSQKRKQLQGHSKKILETYHRLLSKETPIVKKLVYKEEGEIKGHISAIRFYDTAWIIQHLMASKTASGSAARGVLQEINNFFFDSKAHKNTDAHFLVSFYRPNNLYPAILFGETARRINNPLICYTQDFAFGVYNPNQTLEFDQSINFSQDSNSNSAPLVDYLIQKGRSSFLRAIGLGNKNPCELSINTEYENLGLFRQRHIVTAELEGSRVFAIAELSSPGLNLSDITNSIYIFPDCLEDEKKFHLIEQVVQYAYKNFYEPLQIEPTIMAEFDLYYSRNIEWSKIYTCWILSETAAPVFERITDEIFKDFKKLIQEFMANEKQKQEGNSISKSNEANK